MPAKASGAVRYLGGRWCARVELPGEPEKLVPMDQFRSKSQRLAAKAEAKIIAAEARAIWEQTHERRVETVADWADRWVEAKRAKGQTSWKAARSHLDAHILPIVGTKRMVDVTAHDCERIVERLDQLVDDEDLKWKSAVNIWGTVTKMFDDACRGKALDLRARDRDANPTRDVRGPERGKRTQKVHLYPSEFLALVAFEELPLRRRRAYALGVYLYLRPGELEAMHVDDVDLDRGVVTISRAMDRNEPGEMKAPKAGLARLPVEVEPHVLPLLRAMVDDALPDGRLVGSLGDPHDLAAIIRGDLWRAGVRRTELHTMTRTREWMTLHDLRTTGITWMAVRGDAPLTIMARAGHHDVKQTTAYVDAAMLVRRVYGDVFPALPEALLSNPMKVEAMPEQNQQVLEIAANGGGSTWESNRTDATRSADSRRNPNSQRAGSRREAPKSSAELRSDPESLRVAVVGRVQASVVLRGPVKAPGADSFDELLTIAGVPARKAGAS